METFTKSKFDNLADGKCNVEFAKNDFKITASPASVIISGKLEISDETSLQEFAQFLSEAWKEHKKIAPKIITNIKEL